MFALAAPASRPDQHVAGGPVTCAVVSAYFNTGVTLPPAAMWNRTNRGFPDIASVGHNVLINDADYGGCVRLHGRVRIELTSPRFGPPAHSIVAVGGTSCSSPSVAAMMSFLNKISKSKTGKNLGFLSPLLYKMYDECPQCFSDITVGDNKCTENGCSPGCEVIPSTFSCCALHALTRSVALQGFYCAKGWDPVTGLGVPNVANMVTYISKLFDERL